MKVGVNPTATACSRNDSNDDDADDDNNKCVTPDDNGNDNDATTIGSGIIVSRLSLSDRAE